MTSLSWSPCPRSSPPGPGQVEGGPSWAGTSQPQNFESSGARCLQSSSLVRAHKMCRGFRFHPPCCGSARFLLGEGGTQVSRPSIRSRPHQRVGSSPAPPCGPSVRKIQVQSWWCHLLKQSLRGLPQFPRFYISKPGGNSMASLALLL